VHYDAVHIAFTAFSGVRAVGQSHRGKRGRNRSVGADIAVVNLGYGGCSVFECFDSFKAAHQHLAAECQGAAVRACGGGARHAARNIGRFPGPSAEPGAGRTARAGGGVGTRAGLQGGRPERRGGVWCERADCTPEQPQPPAASRPSAIIDLTGAPAASRPSAIIDLTGAIAPEQEMLKMLQLPTPSETEAETPDATPRHQHGQEGRCNTESTVHFPRTQRTPDARHSWGSDDEDDSSDSDDESFVSSQHAIKARSVKSAQKGGPVTSMSSRASRQNTISAGAANGSSAVLVAAYVCAIARIIRPYMRDYETAEMPPRHAYILLSR